MSSSISIQSFGDTNKALSHIFGTDLHDIPHVDSTEYFNGPAFDFFSDSIRRHLIEHGRQIVLDLRSSRKKRVAALQYYDYVMVQTQRQISYLLNRHSEMPDKTHVDKIRELRKVRTLMVRAKKRTS